MASLTMADPKLRFACTMIGKRVQLPLTDRTIPIVGSEPFVPGSFALRHVT